MTVPNPLGQMTGEVEDRRDRLDTLQVACNAEIMRHRFSRLFATRWEAGETLRAVRIEMLRRRKRRCVLRYDLVVGSGNTERVQGLIGKVFKAGEGEPVRRRMQWLAARGFGPDEADGIAVPRVEAYVPELSLLVQEEIGGQAVKELLRSPRAAWALRRMASALAKLHAVPPPEERPWKLEDHLGRCHPPATTLQERSPELRGLVQELLDGAARRMQAHGDVPQALVHGDLHFGQVHVSAERVWMIDWDASCVADPAADLGNAVVFLRSKRHRIPGVERLCEEFLDEYFAYMPSAILERVPLYEALTHLRRACKQTRLQERNWLKRTRRYLEAGLARLGSDGRSVSIGQVE